jgi:GTP-binding protein Era
MDPTGAAAAGPRAGLVAMLGWTNVGKSTLLNRLVGAKLAAVADVAQTTRHRLMGVRNVEGRGQLVLVDTPGLHRPRHLMNRKMVEVARRSLEGVDLALLIADASRGLGEGDRRAAELLERSAVPRWIVLNKIDLVRPKARLLPMMRQAVEEWGFGEAIPVSARTGDGCDELLDRLLDALPVHPPLFPEDVLTDQPERLLAAEWIREQLLAEMRQELPHATAVIVERWHEREDGLVELHAAVLVDRESQKKIVIGRQGQVMKRIGTAARRELEPLLGRRVYLELRVKVRRDWRNDEATLKQLGLR